MTAETILILAAASPFLVGSVLAAGSLAADVVRGRAR